MGFLRVASWLSFLLFKLHAMMVSEPADCRTFSEAQDSRQQAILLSEGLSSLGIQRLKSEPGICLLDERFLGRTVLSGNVNTTQHF